MNKIPVFVYGTLKRGNGDGGLDLWGDGATFVSTGTTTEKQFNMVDLEHFPGAILGGDSDIQGELWMVDAQTMQDLDHMEGYPDFYLRRKTRTTAGTAWMYYLPGDDFGHYPLIKPTNGIVSWR